MTKLIAVMFPDEAKSQEGIRALKELRADGSIRLYASAVIAKDSGGKLSAEEITPEGHGVAAVGALIGALAGLPAGPLGVTIGAAGGAIIGGSAELINQQGDNEFTDEISRQLAPGRSAMVAEIDEDGAATFEGKMHGIGGVIIRQ